MTERSLIDSLNFALSGREGSGFQGPEEKHRTAHQSHNIMEGVCLSCGARDSWEVIEKSCRGDTVDRGDISPEQAGALLPLHVGSFIKWWKEMGFEGLPSIEEWAWNLAEWMAKERK